MKPTSKQLEPNFGLPVGEMHPECKTTLPFMESQWKEVLKNVGESGSDLFDVTAPKVATTEREIDLDLLKVAIIIGGNPAGFQCGFFS